MAELPEDRLNHTPKTHAWNQGLPDDSPFWVAVCGRRVLAPAQPSTAPTCHACVVKLKRKREFPG